MPFKKEADGSIYVENGHQLKYSLNRLQASKCPEGFAVTVRILVSDSLVVINERDTKKGAIFPVQQMDIIYPSFLNSKEMDTHF